MASFNTLPLSRRFPRPGENQTQPVGPPVALPPGFVPDAQPGEGMLRPQVQDPWGRSPGDPEYGMPPGGGQMPGQMQPNPSLIDQPPMPGQPMGPGQWMQPGGAAPNSLGGMIGSIRGGGGSLLGGLGSAYGTPGQATGGLIRTGVGGGGGRLSSRPPAPPTAPTPWTGSLGQLATFIRR